MRLVLPLLALFAVGLSAADLSIPAKGEAAFTVSAPEGWTTIAGYEGSTTINLPQKHPHIQVWKVAGKRTVDEAATDIAAILVPQVKDFVVEQRSDVRIAGGKALLLVGSGTEADDGDPSKAQATVFAVAGAVWVLVSHGEGEGSSERAADVATMLQSVAAAH
jgi:hypothetical protein